MPEGLEPLPVRSRAWPRQMLDGSGCRQEPGNLDHDRAGLESRRRRMPPSRSCSSNCNQVGFNIEILQVDAAELIRRYIDENDFDLFYNAGGVFRADPSISGTYFDTATSRRAAATARTTRIRGSTSCSLRAGRRPTSRSARRPTPRSPRSSTRSCPGSSSGRRTRSTGSATACRASSRRATPTTSSGTPRPGR